MKLRIKMNRIQVISLILSLAIVGTAVGLIVYYGVREVDAVEPTTTTTTPEPTEAPTTTTTPEPTEAPTTTTTPEPTEAPTTTTTPTTPEPFETVLVTISQGELKGRTRLTAKSAPFSSFENIPFAEPPVGNLSFKDPIEATGWDDVRDATVRAPLCLQVNVFNTDELEIIGDEDCLYLNVYTPDISPDNLLPVMVYIHGGGFEMSTDQIFSNVELFMDENVIVVKVNYRLGVFGFLSVITEAASGNWGLKDQVLALKWVRDNIESFGGDKNSVTIFGESAGGASVTLLQISPLAQGLFHKVIAFSGTSLCDWTIQDFPRQKVEQLIEILDIVVISNDLIEQLRNTPVTKLLNASLYVQTTVPQVELQFAPVLEPTSENSFLSDPVLSHYENGHYSDIPTMIGYTNYEYAGFYGEDMAELINTPSYFFPTSWNIQSNQTLFEDAVSQINNFYFDGKDFNPEDQELKINGINLIGDVMFFSRIDDTARILAKYSNNTPSSVYYYRFSYGGSLGNPIMHHLGLQGATHGDELFYIFPLGPIAEGTSDDWTSKRLVKLYTNFAKHGNPTPGPESPLLPVIWSPVTEDEVNYLEINEDLTMGTEPDGNRTQFWRDLKAYVDEHLVKAAL